MKKELLISPIVWETPGNSLANFQEQLKGLREQLGLNGTLLSQLRQQLPAINFTQVAQKLEQISK
jgi:hypothetical protein